MATAPTRVGDQRAQIAEKPHRMWWTLVITSIALFMVTLDNLVVTNALPTIQRDFNASIQDLEWSVNAYTLTFAVLLLTGAALGDRFGRRKMFIIGLAIFTASSAACALATNIAMLDAFRAVQGLGGAIVTPLTLTILSQAFPEERRGLALGLWSGISGFAVALGPVIGGAIVTGIAWQWIFWINVPVGIVTIPLAFRLLRETRGPYSHLDLVGVGLASVGLFGIVWGIIRGSDIGWTQREILVALIGGGIVTTAFVLWELRSRAPMLPMQYFRNRTFATVNTASLLMYFGLFGAIFLLVQFLQVVQHYSALKAGVATLPSTGMPIFIAPLAGALSEKIGGRPLIATGMVLQTIALGWMAVVITPGMSYWSILPPFVIFGIGMGLFFPPVAYLVLGSVPPEAAGQASGANNAIREIGGVFGVGVLSTIFASYGSYRSGQAYTDGLIPAVWVGTVVVGVGAIVSFLIPGRRQFLREREEMAVASAAAASAAAAPAEGFAPRHAQTVVTGGSRDLPALVMADGARLGERFPVAEELSLGREGADVVLDDPQVSRRHAVVRLVAGVLEISDANSANGTFVNGSRIDGISRLADGDSVRLGGTTLAVVLPVARPQAAGPPPVLAVTEGAAAGQRFEVPKELSLGRVDADVLLDDVEVSRRHAIVRFSDGALEIWDADSANGTFVNGSRIAGSQPLADGDLIRLGKTTLRVELPRMFAATVITTGGANTVVTPPPGT